MDYSFVSESECVLVCTEEESWHGFEEPKGLLVIPEEVPMYGSNRRVTMIDACVFSENKKIKRVVIPDSVRSIGHQAFRDTNISIISLPKQLEYIGVEAFARTKISELVFPPHLKEIGTFAFMDTPIRQVILPNTVRTIGHFCFGGCILEKIYLNDGIVSIGYLAFNNSIISEVDVPKSVESIGSKMFSSLTKVRLHCKPPEIIECTFDDDNEMVDHIVENIDEDVLLDKYMVTHDYYYLYLSDRVWRNIDIVSFNNWY